jgi:hypothetical protein
MTVTLKLAIGYDWSSLKNGETIVDVGGGIGSSTMILAKKFPELKFIVQDLPDTIDQGRTVSTGHPNCLMSLISEYSIGKMRTQRLSRADKFNYKVVSNFSSDLMFVN